MVGWVAVWKTSRTECRDHFSPLGFRTLLFARLFRSTLTNGHKLFPQGSGKRWFREEHHTPHTTHRKVLPVPVDATLENHDGKRWFCEQHHAPHTTHREVLPVPGDATLENHSPVGKDVSLRNTSLVDSQTFAIYYFIGSPE